MVRDRVQPNGSPMIRKLRRIGDLKGFRLHASDGEIGKLREVYFNDHRWAVRYLVVDTGSWLLERQVLITSGAVTGVSDGAKSIAVSLSREEVKRSPSPDAAKPVSRHYEEENEPYLDPLRRPAPPPSPAEAVVEIPSDPHLRSSGELVGYRIHADDGEFGHVQDLVVDDQDWMVRYLVADTRHWLPGRRVLLAPAWVRSVNWDETAVRVGLTREAIKSAPPYDPSKAITREYEIELFRHYGETLANK
jgi:hypothetical protein